MMKQSLHPVTLVFAAGLSYGVNSQINYAPDPAPQHLAHVSFPADEHPALSPGEEDFELAWFAPEKPAVARHYEKVEVGIKIPPALRMEINSFFDGIKSNGAGLNPYNRHDIACIAWMKIEDSVVGRTEAFYYTPQKIVGTQFKDDTTSYPFRFRYAPKDLGHHRVFFEIRIEDTLVFFGEFGFEVVPSEHRGYLEIGRNGYHFRHAKTKESFFGVGQCIPWTEWPDGSNFHHKSDFKRLNNELTDYFDLLKGAGGNFTRLVACEWSLQMEVDALGNYQSRRDHAWFLDRLADHCSAEELCFIYCLRIQHEFFAEKHTIDNFHYQNRSGWLHSPYNDDAHPTQYPSEPPIGITSPEDFFSHPMARDHYKNYLRYVVSRWGYSSAIAGWQLMSEINDVGGYGHYYQDTLTPQREAIHSWIDEMAAYMDTTLLDPHPTSVAIVGNSGRETVCAVDRMEIFESPYIDYTGIHAYSFQLADPNQPQRTQNGGIFRNRNCLTIWEAVRNFTMGTNGNRTMKKLPLEFAGKPFIFDEYGTVIHDRSPGEINPTLQFERCSPHKFHNDLWSSACSGSATTGLDWWLSNDSIRHALWKEEFTGIRKFFEAIDFERENYTQVHYDGSNGLYMSQRWPWTESEIRATDQSREGADYRNKDALEGFSMVDDTGVTGFGWMHNRSHYWYNLQKENDCLYEMIAGIGPWQDTVLLRPRDDDKIDSIRPVELGKDFIQIRHLKCMKRYVIEYFDPLTNERIGVEQKRSNISGKLKVAPPAISEEHQDVAYRVYWPRRWHTKVMY